MEAKTGAVIFFFPTGTTKKILNAFCNGLGINNINSIDLTHMSIKAKLTTSLL